MYTDDELFHYGVGHLNGGHSGRFQWGSGDNPYQRYGDFMTNVSRLRDEGLSNTEIARALNMTTGEFRAKISLAKEERWAVDSARALKLKNEGYSNVKIGEMLGLPDTTVGNLLRRSEEDKINVLKNISNTLKDNVDKKGYIDITEGSEYDLGITETKLKAAVERLKEEHGYVTQKVYIDQLTNPGRKTTIKVLCPPGTSVQDVYENLEKISRINDTFVDGGRETKFVQYPSSFDSKRMMVRYDEDGGSKRDGVIEIREGVDDISLGNSRYAQVRILVDGTHYMKGMAMYNNDMPEGVDIIFNTNKKRGTPLMADNKNDPQVLKPIKNDPENPFGALISAKGQREYTDPETGEKKLSPINKLKEEGEWAEYSKSLSSQFLSKQNLPLINRQLDLELANKRAEYDDIMSLNNSEVRKKMLKSFADECDSASVHLKAAALPRQATQVILPIPSMKDNEIYAPNYRDGEEVVLIRYPHAGTFEIPRLKVNNKQGDAKRLIGPMARDAVGINSNVAERLSGADFDGDTVLVIPVNSNVRVKTSDRLEELINFDPKREYPEYPGMKIMSSYEKGIEMGKVSNLITDMTLQGAPLSDIAKAVKHSMVVIDAEKHHLNYKQSEIDNDISRLKATWQRGGGAGTLISRSKGEARIPERKEGAYYTDPVTGKTTKKLINPETGEKLYTNTGSSFKSISVKNPVTGKMDKRTVYTDRDTGRYFYTQENADGSKTRIDIPESQYGRVKETGRTMSSTNMAETKDAHTLSSGHPKEEAYANYANALKAMANQARKEYISTPNTAYSPQAKQVYANEVASLMSKLNVALMNAPKERQAQVIANVKFKAQLTADPGMSKDDKKKLRQRLMTDARLATGASKKEANVKITAKEWEAIQAGAISNTALKKIIDNTDEDLLKQLAMPKQTNELSDAKISKIKAMKASGHTIAQIADAVGYSSSTVSKYLK